jgi:hypothetical protein
MRNNYAPYILRQEGDLTLAKCVNCLIEKEPNQYHRHSVRSDGFIRYRQICKECRKVKTKYNRPRPVHIEIVNSNKQLCKKCKTIKELNEFYCNGCFADGVKKYRSTCKKCILEIRKENHKETYQDKIKKKHSSYKNYISCLLNHCSKRNKNGYNLDIQYLLDLYENQKGLCNISGIKMTHEHGKKETNISIDRIDSSIGYVKGNVQLVCYIVNLMKNTFSIEKLLYFSENIIKHQNNKKK